MLSDHFKCWHFFPFFQAPERIARDKNLSVLSSISVLSTLPEPVSPKGDCTEDHNGGESKRDCETKMDTKMASQSAQTSALEDSTHQKTTPTSQAMSPSIHMALEDYQNQLKSLQEMVSLFFPSNMAMECGAVIFPFFSLVLIIAQTDTIVCACWRMFGFFSLKQFIIFILISINGAFPIGDLPVGATWLLSRNFFQCCCLLLLWGLGSTKICFTTLYSKLPLHLGPFIQAIVK